ncbi:MAG: carbohydrate ABC transporter permease [Chloroflexota bacterium]
MPDRRLRSIAFWCFVLGYLGLVIGPLSLMVMSSFKTNRQIFADPLALPTSLGLDNYANAWDQAHFSTYILNSLLVTGLSVVLTIVVATLASYPLSRYRLPFLSAVLAFFLLGLMLPVRLGIVPLFLLLRDLGLLDSHLGLILVYTAIRLPFAIFIITSFMRTIPSDLEEAARLDGASEMAVLGRVLLPLVKPAVGIVAIFTIIAVWNDFFLPLIFISPTSSDGAPRAHHLHGPVPLRLGVAVRRPHHLVDPVGHRVPRVRAAGQGGCHAGGIDDPRMAEWPVARGRRARVRCGGDGGRLVRDGRDGGPAGRVAPPERRRAGPPATGTERVCHPEACGVHASGGDPRRGGGLAASAGHRRGGDQEVTDRVARLMRDVRPTTVIGHWKGAGTATIGPRTTS